MDINNFIKQWDGLGVIPNLPPNCSNAEYKGFLLLMGKEKVDSFYTYCIVALDDNLNPASLVGYPKDITFECKFDVNEKDFKIKKLDTQLTAYLYSSEKYRFLFKTENDYCVIKIIK